VDENLAETPPTCSGQRNRPRISQRLPTNQPTKPDIQAPNGTGDLGGEVYVLYLVERCRLPTEKCQDRRFMIGPTDNNMKNPLRNRVAIRVLSFVAVLSYAALLELSPRHLQKLLDAAFEQYNQTRGDESDPSRIRVGRTRTRYNHIYSNATDVIARISFNLHDPKDWQLSNDFNLYVKCPLGEVTIGKRKVPTGEYRSGKLPQSLVRDDEGNRILDFTTTISTDLKILIIGDSVGVQLAQAFDEMVGGKELESRTVVWEAWRGHDGGTVVAPTRGGGVSALWRMTGLLSKKMKGKPPANSGGGGWSDKEPNLLLANYDKTKADINDQTIGSYDTVVFRVMHGWMKIDEITHERLVEAVELAHELLGAETVVLMTVPFTNNVKTFGDLMKVKLINEDMRNIAEGWQLREHAGVRHVLVLEYETFYNHIIWTSARHLGYNVSNPLHASQQEFDVEGQTFLFDRLVSNSEWPASIPMVCADTTLLKKYEKKRCDRNYLFSDGMHTCPESLASRFGAALACLLGCVYNRGHHGPRRNTTQEGIRACEKDCNDQFSSVAPVDDELIGNHTTLASFSGTY